MTLYIIIGGGVASLVVILMMVSNAIKARKAKAAQGSPDEKAAKHAQPRYRKGLSRRTRNLLISILLLMVAIGWSYLAIGTINRTNRELHAQKKALEEKIKQELERARQETLRMIEVKEKLAQVQDEVRLNNKVMMTADESARTLRFFLDLASQWGQNFPFNLSHTEDGNVANDNEVKYNKYILSGESYCDQLFGFVDQLERQAPFYAIESVAMDAVPAEREGRVEFSIEVLGYFTDKGQPIEMIPLEPNQGRNLSYNPFFPQVHSPLEDDDEEFLSKVSVEEATLVALSGDRAFVKDNSTGIIHILGVGSEVRYGYLDHIELSKDTAVFRINKTGISEYHTLKFERQVPKPKFLDDTYHRGGLPKTLKN